METKIILCNNIDILLSTNDDDNKILEKLIAPLENAVKINRMTNGQKLFARCDLPLLQTDVGDNIRGLRRIKRFVERESRARKK